MADVTENSSEGDGRLGELLAAYVRSVEAGQPLDREELLAANPDLAGELRSFFANREAVVRLAEPLRQAAGEAPTIGLDGAAADGGLGRVRYVGDYELLEEIARGGMGIVYRARQVSLNRPVAVKMILAGQLAGDSAIQRFRQEAEAAASLDHPNIVPIYEVGEHAGQHYFAMGLVVGTSLAGRLAAGPLPAREAAELVRTVAQAVQFAHDRGIIHRDLKPANILLDADGRPRVTDFGLAKRTEAGHTLTETGQVLGTPGYMPPEQVQSKEIGPGADVYALGAILYALLTGRPPFVAATPMETMLQVLDAEPVAPRQLNPSVPRDLDTIALKCLEKRPAWRYASAQELADELGRHLAGEPIRARRPGIVEQGSRWLAKQKRSVALAIGVAAVTAALVIGVIGGMAVYQKSLEGKLGLDTEHARLIAEVRDDKEKEVLPPFTVPTQQPVVLPAGEYTMRASGKELLSEEFGVRIDRGHTQQLKISLADQALWPTTDIAGAFYVVPTTVGSAAALLDLHEKGVHFSAPSLKQDLWTRTFEPLDDPKLKVIPTFQWPWTSQYTILTSGYGPYDFRPLLLEPRPQLDNDQLGDIVLACRHQPVVIAFSANKGNTLWAYAPPELAEVEKAQKERVASGDGFRTGTIAGPPLVVPDIDGDGTVDLIVSSVLAIPERQNDAIQAKRLVDAVSGKTGVRIWSYPLPEQWFELLNVPSIPQAAAWFARQRGSGGSGRVTHPYGNTFRDSQKYTVSGEAVFLPSPLRLMHVGGRDVVAFVAGNRVVLLDPKTGQQAVRPQVLEFVPKALPKMVRAGKQLDDQLLLVQGIAEDKLGVERHALWLWSPAAGKPSWVQSPFTANYEKDHRFFEPRPKWPLVADLDGDGADEIITASDSSLDPYGPSHTASSRAWGEISLLGKTQEDLPVWTRRMETVDQQVDQFVAGPDVNGDGWRDLFAANIFSRGMNSGFVYVEAISGQTGEILWSSGQPFNMQARNQIDAEVVGALRWWNQSRLIVPVIDGHGGQSRGLFIFAAADGRLLHSSSDLVPAQIADGDGDEVADLFCFTPAFPSQADRGGKLHTFRGTGEPAWRRMGTAWQAAGDLNGDGAEDVVSQAVEYVYGEQVVATRSGKDGGLLFRAAADHPIWVGARVVPLGADLNGDGSPDFATVDSHRGSDGETPFLHAFSGQTGRELWKPSFGAGSIGASLLIEARDLEGDGRPELIYVAEMSFAGTGGANPSYTDTPLWLVVLDGASGKLRWKQMLNDRAATNTGTSRSLAVAYGDLNGDQVDDIITPAVIFKNQYPELRTYNGKTGEELWSPVPLPGDGGQDGQYVVDYLPRPTVADLDGDGKLEILVQDSLYPAEFETRDVTKEARTAPVGGRTGAAAEVFTRVMVLHGDTGKPKWHQQMPIGSTSWQYDDSSSTMGHYRSRPVLVRRGTDRKPAVCIWLFAGDWQKPEAKIILLENSGGEFWRLPVNLRVGNRYLGVFVHDLTGDGADEIVFVDVDSVQAWDGATQKQIWSWPLGNWMASILSIEPATDKTPAQVVVAHGRQVLGLAGPTGQPLWTCAGLPEDHMPTSPLKLALLRDGGGRHPPRILFSGPSGETTCYTATPAADSPVIAAKPVIAQKPAGRDPRFARPLPWTSLDGNVFFPFARPLLMVHGLVLSLALVVFPAYILYHLAWRRRYGLGFFLLIPAAVGLAIAVLQIPIERMPGQTPWATRQWILLTELPALVGLGLVGYWLAQGRWIRPAVMLGLFVVVTLSLGETWLSIDREQMDPREYYDWSRWWTLLYMSAYAISVFVPAEWLIGMLFRKVFDYLGITSKPEPAPQLPA